MKVSKVAKLVTLLVAGLSLCFAQDAQAQVFHRHYHGHNHGYYYARPQHYHDAAGHVVDAYGHHTDAYGRHTGGVGVYDNHSIPSSLGIPYSASYGGYSVGGYANPPVAGGASVAPNPPPDFGLPITIVSPDSIRLPINYSLNGFRYTIRPGEVQSLVNDRSWVIQFDRGGEYGFARYGLSPGTFEFSSTAQGWELVHDKAPPANPLPAPNPAPPAPRVVAIDNFA